MTNLQRKKEQRHLKNQRQKVELRNEGEDHQPKTQKRKIVKIQNLKKKKKKKKRKLKRKLKKKKKKKRKKKKKKIKRKTKKLKKKCYL